MSRHWQRTINHLHRGQVGLLYGTLVLVVHLLPSAHHCYVWSSISQLFWYQTVVTTKDRNGIIYFCSFMLDIILFSCVCPRGHLFFFVAILAIMNNRQMKANGWTFGGEKPAAYMHGPTWKRKIRWRKKAKRLSSSNIVTESFGPEGKRRHERLALLLQA